jgi:hypothetical protein
MSDVKIKITEAVLEDYKKPASSGIPSFSNFLSVPLLTC